MATDIPTTEPSIIVAGDTIAWDREDLTNDYPSSTWTLKYHLANRTSHYDITATADTLGDDTFSITITPAVTATYVAGFYNWDAYVSKGSGATLERYRIDFGTLEVRPNLASLPASYDDRTHVKRTLDAIEAVIEGRATSDQESYTIGNRSLSRIPIAELLKFRSQYALWYQNELAAEAINNGVGTGRRVVTRFVD
jgi:hypothetical protein